MFKFNIAFANIILLMTLSCSTACLWYNTFVTVIWCAALPPADEQTVAVLTLQLSAPTAAGFAAAAAAACGSTASSAAAAGGGGGSDNAVVTAAQPNLAADGLASPAGAPDARAAAAAAEMTAARVAPSGSVRTAERDAAQQQQQQSHQQLEQQPHQPRQLQQQQQQPLYFQVVLPPTSSGHAEFVILQSRFESSLQRTWQAGDRVQVRGLHCGSAAGFG
jgi:hypothetical protein